MTENEMGEACFEHGRKEKGIQSFGWNIWKVVWKRMRG